MERSERTLGAVESREGSCKGSCEGSRKGCMRGGRQMGKKNKAVDGLRIAMLGHKRVPSREGGIEPGGYLMKV